MLIAITINTKNLKFIVIKIENIMYEIIFTKEHKKLIFQEKIIV